ncbi:MAG: ribosome small subunit-dependent GTPase A [Lewinellaceae bacterium]|nr:ribosome small subunit-dependent GTPase A [Phaeodactylibacter sp.]MCB0614354.1 ribosome small subunit-dependent GTPase A [Phaeodactylibacter sp.]MCB9349875.1 ribosome small subunit-dependent GTPase A [Lewinellaceae bacterium]
MTLEDLGYTIELANYRREQRLDAFEVGRVVSEHKERYGVKTAEGEFDAELIGHLRYSAQERAGFPVVGDWVAIQVYDEQKALIHGIFPRKNRIERRAVGKHGEKQVIATNIDYAFIVQAVGWDFNINRIERYLTICNASNVEPILLFNKIDLISEPELNALVESVRARAGEVPVIPISNETRKGYPELNQWIEKGKTYCLLGSSGVGKSTLINNLSGRQLMKTNSISESTSKGRHVTSHREMVVLPSGGVLIDNPGMREVGIADSAGGLEMTFQAIVELAKECKFKDCTHTNEPGCVVLAAVACGELDEEALENYLKMEREKEHYESTVAERRRKDKAFGKMVKSIKKNKKTDKP